jgi:hypothetical protein
VKIVSQLKLLAMLSIERFKVVLKELIYLLLGFKIIKHLMLEIKPHIFQTKRLGIRKSFFFFTIFVKECDLAATMVQ